MQIVDEVLSQRTSGLSFRRSKAGPEQELVDWFLDQHLVEVPRGHRLTVFREPRLLSGFPDLVFVIWKESVTRKWSCNRSGLGVKHLQLMHLLATNGPRTSAELLCTFQRPMVRELERLEEACMVRYAKGHWKAKPIEHVFAATQIIAIEAKIAEWKAAVEQAHINTWFASESCILVPRVPKRSQLLQEAEERGVTVLAKEDEGLRSFVGALSKPRSYVSWLFNEWAWQAAASLRG